MFDDDISVNVYDNQWILSCPTQHHLLTYLLSRCDLIVINAEICRACMRVAFCCDVLTFHFYAQEHQHSYARLNSVPKWHIYSASAACDECSGSSHNEFVAVPPCETSVETVTLAAGWAKNNLQAAFDYVLHPHRTSTKIPFRLWLLDFQTTFPQFLQPVQQISPEVHWLSGLRSAKNKNKIRWTWLLLLRSNRLEHSSIRPSWHYWYEYIPKTTQ